MSKVECYASQLRGHSDTVTKVAPSTLSPFTVLSSSLDRTVKFWDVRSGKAERTMKLPAPSHCVCESPDGSTMAAGADAALLYWDARSWKKVRPRALFSFG